MIFLSISISLPAGSFERDAPPQMRLLSPGCIAFLAKLFFLVINSCSFAKSKHFLLFRIHGSYEAICGGFNADALVDLTGGIALHYDLNDHSVDEQKEFFRTLQRYRSR